LIFLTAKSQKQDILRGYSIGADDYVSKPFDTEVLLCKIKAMLSRKGMQEENEKQEEYSIGQFTFFTKTRELQGLKGASKLSPKEGALLEMLCEQMNDVLPRDRALNEIWKDNSYFTTRSMDVHITKLRKYLSADTTIEIVNVHGSGYRLMVPLLAE
ncbi:MAG: response regulator transcription factor, partial [Flavobacteriales bacterium]|nr:response regulator transcription factor [Flavobacteriales bacterium]